MRNETELDSLNGNSARVFTSDKSDNARWTNQVSKARFTNNCFILAILNAAKV